MGILNRLAEAVVPQREAAPVHPVMIGTPAMGFNTSVTPTTVLGLSAVAACLNVLSNGVSQLPWRETYLGADVPPSPLVERPQSATTRREWTSMVVSILALYEWSYSLKMGTGAWPINPAQVMPAEIDNLFMLPSRSYWVGGTKMDRDQLLILRRSPTPGIGEMADGILRLARVNFAANLAAEQYASRYWQSGGSPVTALETDLHLNATEAGEIADRWAERRARGPDYPPVLSGGMKAHPYGADPTQEAAVEARRDMVADIGRFFGVPTRMINAPSSDSETYTSTESANLDLVRFTLQNYIGAIEDGISDMLPSGHRMHMDISALTRGTQYTRAQAWQLATAGTPWMLPEEVREAEGLPPLESPSLLAVPSIPGDGIRRPSSTMSTVSGSSTSNLPETQGV